ncbi:MAG TPA: TonB-dependent receptor [Terricaulis sp.]|nr:TonB-dependent receptor [Terricaulis sp.]HRP10833.1 TonB-dependent receptor [Terricaulis sp.]
MKSKLGILLTGASLAALGAIAPAAAQETTDEIVVTATGRSAAIQDVPLAVTAVDAQTIQNSGVQDLRDMTQLVPSLQIGTGQSAATGVTARVRGIGTGSDNPGFESAVGIFVDGVYRARAGAAMTDLPDLQRIEVLRGPQGTLFGRNTSAGAISVITAGPDHDFGGYVEAMQGFDDMEEGNIKAGVNVALSDTFAFRLDGSIRARDGYVTDLTSGRLINDRDRYSLRGQALWDISNDASLRIIVDVAETDEICCGVTPLTYGTQVGLPFGVPQYAIHVITAGAGTPAINPEGRGMTITPGRGYGEVTEEQGISGQLDWDLGFANFTSITAFRNWDAVRDQDVDFNFIDVAYRDGLEVGFHNFTQEFRLQGEAGRLDWLVGVFYGDERMYYNDTIRTGAHSSIYANTVANIATQAMVPGGCELYPINPATPSIFQCAAVQVAGGNPVLLGALMGAVNSVNATSPTNAGHLSFNAAGDGQQSDRWRVNTESIALFTHNVFSITDQLELTFGLRYSDETKRIGAGLLSVSPSCTSLQQMETATSAVLGGGPGLVSILQAGAASSLMNLACNPAVNTSANGTWTGERDEGEFSGTMSLSYHLTDDLMLFGGYSRGYKAGGYNTDRSGFQMTPATTSQAQLNINQVAFDPEFTDAIEFGFKSTILGGTSTFNVTAFYQQIADYQLNAFNGFNFITRNIPDVISQGAEIEFNSRPTDNLSFNLGVVYTDAYFDSTVVFNPLNPGPNTVRAGEPLAFSAEWVVTGGVGYTQPIGDNLQLTAYVDGRWSSEYQTQTLARNPITDQDAFAVFNGRLGVGAQDGRWSVEFWGQNLTDEFYYVGAFSPPLQDGTLVIYPSMPQTYGITLRARY